MTACITPSPDAPVDNLMLFGTGEPLMKLEKRLSCTASGLASGWELRYGKDAVHWVFRQTPAVLHEGKVI